MKESKIEMENNKVTNNKDLSIFSDNDNSTDSIQKRFCEDCEIKVHNNRRYLRKRKKKEENKIS